METISEIMKKIMLAGIGAVAVTAEKSREVLEELVSRGELSVEQGKVLNEELKHNVKEAMQRNAKQTGNESAADGTGRRVSESSDDISRHKEADPAELLKSMTPGQIAQLKELLRQLELEKQEEISPSGADTEEESND